MCGYLQQQDRHQVLAGPYPPPVDRPMVFKAIAITELNKVDLAELDMKKLNKFIEMQL